MPGGLVELITSGSQNMFLTGYPQITFFKIIYRRYTNFAIESITQYFIGDINFDREMSCIIDKIGDLMYRVYLEVDLPAINLIRHPTDCQMDCQTAICTLQLLETYYQLVVDYVSVNVGLTRRIAELLRATNIELGYIQSTMNEPAFFQDLLAARLALETYVISNVAFDTILDLVGTNKLDLLQIINKIDIGVIATNATNKIDLLYYINYFLYPLIRTLYMPAYDAVVHAKYLLANPDNRYAFAWVEEIGHAIVDTIDIKIGNQVIDKQTGDWLILFHKLSANAYQEENYNKMIGNVPVLTSFDNNIKPQYKLHIPLPFWFCRTNGAAIPLVALRYQDIVITLKTKDLAKLCFVEDAKFILDPANMQAMFGINLLDAKLVVDYVFLDTDERRRFAQSTHEYLIETVQYRELEAISSHQYNIHLEFTNPTKYMVWFFQPNYYRSNPTGRNRCQWNRFGPNPILTQTIRLNTYDLFRDPDGKFCNLVYPYLYFKRSVPDGLYVYSFSLRPLEFQPTSSCNFSRIDDLGLDVTFSTEFNDLVSMSDTDPGIYFAMYTVSYNILRFMGGMCGKAFKPH